MESSVVFLFPSHWLFSSRCCLFYTLFPPAPSYALLTIIPLMLLFHHDGKAFFPGDLWEFYYSSLLNATAAYTPSLETSKALCIMLLTFNHSSNSLSISYHKLCFTKFLFPVIWNCLINTEFHILIFTKQSQGFLFCFNLETFLWNSKFTHKNTLNTICFQSKFKR